MNEHQMVNLMSVISTLPRDVTRREGNVMCTRLTTKRHQAEILHLFHKTHGECKVALQSLAYDKTGNLVVERNVSDDSVRLVLSEENSLRGDITIKKNGCWSSFNRVSDSIRRKW